MREGSSGQWANPSGEGKGISYLQHYYVTGHPESCRSLDSRSRPELHPSTTSWPHHELASQTKWGHTSDTFQEEGLQSQRASKMKQTDGTE